MTDPEPSRSQAKRLAAQGKPPETSRELAALVRNSIQMDMNLNAIAREQKATSEAAALIDAYVLEREDMLVTALIDRFNGYADSCKKDSRVAWAETIYRKMAHIMLEEAHLATARASQRSPREKPR